MPIIYVNPAGKPKSARASRASRRRVTKARARKLARTKSGQFAKATRTSRARLRKSTSGRPVKKTKRRVHPAMRRLAAAWVASNARVRKTMAKRKKTKRSRRRKSVAVAKMTVSRRRKSRKTVAAKTVRRSSKRRRYGTKSVRRLAAAKGYKLVKRAKRRKARARKRGHGRRTRRVAKHMMAAYKHKTYPVANPGRRRRKRRANPHRRHRRNPHRRAHRRYRRNPSMAGLMQLAKRALPALAGLVGGKFIVKQLSGKVPGISGLGTFQNTALSVGLLLLGDVITDKVAALRKHKDMIMVGLGINVATDLLAMTPLQGMLGLGDGIYDRALSDYVTTSDYLTTGAAPPIDDNIALADYVTTGGIEEELGELSQELGLTEELGAIDAGTVPGGMSQMAMIKAVPHQSFQETVPARSFTEAVPRAGAGYDNPGGLYTGVFRGGF